MRAVVHFDDVINRGCEGRADVAAVNKESRIIIAYLYASGMTKTTKGCTGEIGDVRASHFLLTVFVNSITDLLLRSINDYRYHDDRHRSTTFIFTYFLFFFFLFFSVLVSVRVGRNCDGPLLVGTVDAFYSADSPRVMGFL